MLRPIIAVSLLASFLGSLAYAQSVRPPNPGSNVPTWVLLGARHVDFGADYDRFNVGRAEEWWKNRSFQRLHIFVDENDIRLFSIRIVYQNRYVEETQINPPDGVEIKAIPGRFLPFNFPGGGNRQFIDTIELKYRSLHAATSTTRAVVRIIGEMPPITDARDEWIELGCQPVQIFGRDRDVFRVGLREGRFKALRLRARHASVRIHDMRVIYVNGTPDDISVKHNLRPDEVTRTLPLEVGRRGERAIERVELSYSSDVNAVDIVLGEKVRQPVVCVEGLEHNVPF